MPVTQRLFIHQAWRTQKVAAAITAVVIYLLNQLDTLNATVEESVRLSLVRLKLVGAGDSHLRGSTIDTHKRRVV